MVGLGGAGKSAILHKLDAGRGEVATILHHVGFNVETVQSHNIHMFAWDVGGRKNEMRPIWRHYFLRIDALIFVVDSNDRERIGEAREELQCFLRERDLENVLLLVFANKQDLPSAMSVDEVTDNLSLPSIQTHTWHIQGTCATSGKGLNDGFDWLSHTLSSTALGQGESIEETVAENHN